jgi:cytochrome c biogenesis protein CcmG/thiol:disulfide interchange protein DsbE
MHSWSVKKPKKQSLAALGIALALLASCRSSHSGQIQSAANFELKDLSGNTVRLESFRGHPVLLDFWATWCGPCRMSIPLVQEFYMRHKKEGLMVLGLNMDDEPSGVYGFVKQFHMTYPVLFAGNSSVPNDYEVEGIPHFVFIDPQGHILRVYQGFSPDMVGGWEEDLAAANKKS